MNDVVYSVRVKNGAAWRRFARLRLMISVGQPYHEDGKLQAVVDWINRNPQITDVHVSVNDLLQRHNSEAAGLGPKHARSLAAAEGALWLARCEPILSQLTAARTTTRWQAWLEHKDFATTLAALHDLIQQDIGLADALEKDSVALAERRLKRGEPVAALRTMKAHSREYVLEEMAVFALQCRDLPAAEAYPGSNLNTAEHLVGKQLPASLMPLSTRHFTRIDFARISAVTPAIAALRRNVP